MYYRMQLTVYEIEYTLEFIHVEPKAKNFEIPPVAHELKKNNYAFLNVENNPKNKL